jgi:MOSC domain-containing protein YiiM
MTTPHLAAIAVRTGRGRPMRELSEALAEAGGGLTADIRVSPNRGVTLLSRRQWQEAMRELGIELPWHTRRANLLIEGAGSLRPWIGQSITIGEIELEIMGETEPCSVMDRQQPGLRRALTPECRGGVHARVIRGGYLRVGDAVRLANAVSCHTTTDP